MLVCLALAIGPESQAQETSAPVNNAQPASVHQIGIVHSGTAMESADLLDLPEFVHSAPAERTSNVWLEFSALYITLPQMTTEHMVFTLRQGLARDNSSVAAWYPYAGYISPDRNVLEWQKVMAGVMADGLDTSHPVWMAPRAVETAATLKVYKPGPPGSQPDDEGTTEGDVYLFMRAVATTAPISLKRDTDIDEWVIVPDATLTASENTAHAWVVQAKSPDQISARRVQLAAADGRVLETRTKAAVEFHEHSTSPLELRVQLNEALAGNGLRPDEAAAQSELVIQSLLKARGPAIVYLLPQEWTDRQFPLQIDGRVEKPLRVFVGISRLQ